MPKKPVSPTGKKTRTPDKTRQTTAAKPAKAQANKTDRIDPADQSAKATKTKTQNPKPFPIVGIGASAGGLEALEAFISHIPPDQNMAFVIIQHLSPSHKSIMASLLGKRTRMTVREIKDGTKVQPDSVYLNPPNKNVAIINSKLHLSLFHEIHGARLPIDYFFRSLAKDQGEKAICVVLSGTGTDGTLGLKAIKGAGGLTMAQEEIQAKYPGMPRSAIDTGMVDFILPVEKMPDELAKYVRHPYIRGPVTEESEEHPFSMFVDKIFIQIRSQTGHDFSHYKRSTIHRRIQRRMAVHQIDKIADYVRYLQRVPGETDILFKDLLIGVTNFFRDPEAFKALKEKVLPNLLKDKTRDTPLRVWVAGCATGEEAYSIAILLLETMEEMKNHVELQIFATDLDHEALDYARSAAYPDSIAADVSPQRLDRFFVKEDNTYKIKKKIREMVIFADQNLIKDPPFSRLDIVCCRNLLIYMDSYLQKKILPLFNYTLVPGGAMFLGSSESIGDFIDLFQPVDIKWKIYRRKEAFLERAADYHGVPLFKTLLPLENCGKHEKNKMPGKLEARHLIEKVILDNYAPPCVLVNERYEILYFIGHTDRYLASPAGEPSFNILKMAREGLRYKLNAALHKVINQKKAVVEEGVRVKQNGDFRTVNLVVRPFVEPDFPQNLIMVLFDDKTSPPSSAGKKRRPATGKEADPQIAALEQELYSTKEYLQTIIEELETSNEELKSTNEELQSVNEELQSTNEELETSKEELQSTNEELVTVNAELQKKVEELSQANNDMSNLLASTDIGTIFLDDALCIKRFTPAITSIFNLIPSDMGRPISHITSNMDNDRLQRDAREVLKTLVWKEQTIQTGDGKWYAMHIKPYRTTENVIDGLVITFMDISHLKQVEEFLRESVEQYRALAENSRDYILRFGRDCRPAYANAAALMVSGMTAEQLAGKTHRELGFPEDLCALWEKAIDKVFKTGKPQSEIFEWERPDGRKILDWMFMPEFSEDGAVSTALGVAREVKEIMARRKEKKD